MIDTYLNEGIKVLFRVALVVLDWGKKFFKKAKVKTELFSMLNNIEKGSDYEALFKEAFSYSVTRVVVKPRKKEEEKPLDLAAHGLLPVANKVTKAVGTARSNC